MEVCAVRCPFYGTNIFWHSAYTRHPHLRPLLQHAGTDWGTASTCSSLISSLCSLFVRSLFAISSTTNRLLRVWYPSRLHHGFDRFTTASSMISSRSSLGVQPRNNRRRGYIFFLYPCIGVPITITCYDGEGLFIVSLYAINADYSVLYNPTYPIILALKNTGFVGAILNKKGINNNAYTVILCRPFIVVFCSVCRGARTSLVAEWGARGSHPHVKTK